MELKLNVYKGGSVSKTYSTNEFVLTTGVCEDILNLVDIETLAKGGLDEKELGLKILILVQKSFPVFRPFFQDIFEGLTDEEFRKTSIKEVAQIIMKIIKYTTSELYSIETTKN